MTRRLVGHPQEQPSYDQEQDLRLYSTTGSSHLQQQQHQQQLLTTTHRRNGSSDAMTSAVIDLSSMHDHHHPRSTTLVQDVTYAGEEDDCSAAESSGSANFREDPLTSIPPEVALHILSFLTDNELGVAASVCRDWYGLANDDLVWRERFDRRFGAAGRKKKHVKPDDLIDEGQEKPDLESGAAREISGDEETELEDEGVADEEETQQLEGIRRLLIPSPLSNSVKWKTRYVERHVEPQIKLLRILSENTSLGRLMDKQRLKKIESTILHPNRVLLENLGKYPHLMSAFTAKRSLVQTKLEFLQHITKNLLFCLLGLVIWGCTEVFSPDFFNYPYLYIPFTWINLGRFWPLFIYSAVLCIGYNWLFPPPASLRRMIFLWSVANSVLAGLLEECGFRFLYICSAMLSLLFADYFIKGVLLLLAGLTFYAGILMITGLVRRPLNQINRNEIISALVTMVLWVLFAYGATLWVVMWIYEMIILPGTDWLTFGFFDESRRLFICGMLVANGWFRDAHKYTGLLGWANSWIIGFTMMYACVHYGLVLTIVLHGLYDLEFVVLSYMISSARTTLGCLPSEPVLPIVVS